MIDLKEKLEDVADLSKFALPLLAAIAMSGCAPAADTPMQKVSPSLSNDIEVKRVGVIDDDLAYNSRRGIYIIIDKRTGKEFIGVSGVGISETGHHSSGKSSVTDER